MSLPAPNLDDLRFQRDLVDEARRRINRYCPEWTEYNLSDPGITLIELFAWMTELITYRLNQVPEKNYVKFLELLGIQRQPASSARTDLTFWLSVPLPISPTNEEPVIIPNGTEVASRLSGEGEGVIFTTDRQLNIVPPKLTQLRRGEDFHKNYLPRLGIETFYTFNRQKPEMGDTFYLGFDDQRDISGHILQLSFECEQTQAVGVRREDPPWVWECSLGDGQWQEVAPSSRIDEKDTTGGLNNPIGSLILYLPLDVQPDNVFGRYAFWVRCRFERRRQEQGTYTESPRVVAVKVCSIGAAVPATHAVVVQDEILGQSNGEPNQSFVLQNAPVLRLATDERVEIEEKRYGETEFVPWQQVDNFSQSDAHDRHFVLDTGSGEITFGPCVRQPDGTMRQYGRVPESNRLVRINRYRHGGGVKGNLPIDSLQILTTSLAYVTRVTNLTRAAGGRDAETMEEAKARAQRELRAQLRAVTAEDYELMAKAASRTIARAKCNTPDGNHNHLPPGMVEVLVVPAVADSILAGDLTKLHIDEGMAKVVRNHLDQYRLLTTTLQIREPSYLGVRAKVEIVPSEFSRPEAVRGRVIETLRAFITPLALPSTDGTEERANDGGWEGWPFGRNLYVAEVLSLVQRVPGVKHVLDVQLSTRPVIPREEVAPDSESPLRGGSDALEGLNVDLTPADGKVIEVPSDTLLCSLDHDVVVTNLEADHD